MTTTQPAPQNDPAQAPPGYQLLARVSPYADQIGPVFTRGQGRDLRLGLRVELKHCNSRGLVHGGVVSGLADIALGHAAVLGADPPLVAVTASLHVDFLGSARVGDWLEASLEWSQAGSSLVFANGYLRVGARAVARASALFAVRGT